MLKVHISRKLTNLSRMCCSRHPVSIVFVLLLLFLTACREQEIWLSCSEEYGKKGNEQVNSFYLKIKRMEDNKLDADYIDAYNSTKITAKETSIAFNFSANVYPRANKRRIVQAIYSINKQTLQFSKTTRHFHSTPLIISPEYIGGISIKNAGACQKLNQKPQSLI